MLSRLRAALRMPLIYERCRRAAPARAHFTITAASLQRISLRMLFIGADLLLLRYIVRARADDAGILLA